MQLINRFLWTSILLAFCTTNAQAERGRPVTEKPRSDYDAIGIKIGGLVVKPNISLGVEFNDNIYATEENTVSDSITLTKPEVEIRSDWSRHAFGLNAGLTSGLYAANSDENFLDGHLAMDGRLDVQRESFLTGQVGIQKLHEDRSSPDSSSAWKDPADYTQSNADISYMHGLGRTSLTAGTGITVINYDNVELLAGGTEDLSGRNRNLYNVNARAAYELLPTVKPFVSGRYEKRAYELSEVGRDSDGYRLGVGTGFDLGGVTTGEIYGGYMQQNYEDQKNISGPWFGMNLLWNVTQLTSVQAKAQSSIKETTLDNSPGINAVDGSIRIDHELLRNLLVGGFIDYTRDDYQSADIIDTLTGLGPRATYLVNRYLSAEASYTYRTKDSTESSREYTENVFFISLTGKY